MRELTMGSLFAGTGGFELAGERNGIKTLWNCEIDELKRAKLKKNFPHVYQYADIRDCKYPPPVDILTGGFPCQDLSIANQSNKGTKGISGERSGLWKEYARILGEIRPSVIVFENSPRLLVSGLETVLCDLSKAGYNVEWRCFYATLFGYPHFRERVYGVAYSTSVRWEAAYEKGGILAEVYKQPYPTRQPNVPLPAKRFNARSDYSCVRMDDGFPKGLDQSRIHDCGNAVVVDIPEAIFKQIKLHWPQ